MHLQFSHCNCKHFTFYDNHINYNVMFLFTNLWHSVYIHWQSYLMLFLVWQWDSIIPWCINDIYICFQIIQIFHFLFIGAQLFPYVCLISAVRRCLSTPRADSSYFHATDEKVTIMAEQCCVSSVICCKLFYNILRQLYVLFDTVQLIHTKGAQFMLRI